MFAALDNPARQGLAWNIDAVATEYFFEAMQRQTVDVFGGQQHRQHTGTSHALFNQLRWLVSGDRSGFTATAAVDLADVFDHADLHRHDFQLLAGFFADGVLAAAASTSQLVLGQFVDDFDTGQVGGQRLAFATAFGRSDDFFLRLFGGRFSDTFGFIKKSQLRGRWDRLFVRIYARRDADGAAHFLLRDEQPWTASEQVIA
ncbi:hypothetical protein D3C81_985690 [compost metagenome]